MNNAFIEHEIEIRVRYQETDAQGRVHHANYLTYFEQARVEMLRAAGVRYRDLESQGVFLVVAEATCQYHLGAEYDDLLRIRASTTKAKGARIEHRYEVYRADELLAVGRTLVACVDGEGRVKRLPSWLREKLD